MDVDSVNAGAMPGFDRVPFCLLNTARDKLRTQLGQFRGPRLKSTNQNATYVGPGIVPNNPAQSLLKIPYQFYDGVTLIMKGKP